MKKFVLFIVLLALIGGAYYIYKLKQNNQSDLLVASGSESSFAGLTQESLTRSSVSLDSMLSNGIRTNQGVLKSESLANNNLEQYMLTLDGKPLPIAAVSAIQLIKAFVIDTQQIMLFEFNQGGNQCERQYQLINFSQNGVKISPAFGTCLPLTSAIESNGVITLKMPQNNPYLGADVLVTYQYQNAKLRVLTSVSNNQLTQKYAKLSAAAIIATATNDGCYVTGVFLEDNSCDNGRKYCVMFKHLPAKAVKDNAYYRLKQFCRGD